MTAIRRVTGPDGAAVHLVPLAPERLPTVTQRDLERAWLAAHHQAQRPHPSPARAFRFATGATLTVTDPDAQRWVSAIEASADLATAYGISLCLRLLSLITLIAHSDWCAPHLQFRGEGCPVDARLLKAASLATLTPHGALNPAAVRTLLSPDFTASS